MNVYYRWGLIFIVTIFTGRLVPGMLVEEHWSLQAFIFAFIVSGLNAGIPWILKKLHVPLGWLSLGITGFLINGAIYFSVARGLFLFIGISSTQMLSAFFSGLIVFLIALILNHSVVKPHHRD